MLAAIQSLAEFLGGDPLRAEDVIEAVGMIVEDYGPNVLLKPRDPLFSAANLVRTRDLTFLVPTNIPSHIELTPAEPPTIEALVQAFGEYREIPKRRNIPPSLIFYLDLTGYPYTVALIAEVRQGLVTKITLRRDIRL